MLIYIIRHGETALNVRRVKQGWLDEPLNESGRHLAVLTGQALKGVRFVPDDVRAVFSALPAPSEPRMREDLEGLLLKMTES